MTNREGRGAAIVSAGRAVRAVKQRRAQSTVLAIAAAGRLCQAQVAERGELLRHRAQERLKIGAPPNMRSVVGVQRLEVPLNRVLGSLLDPAVSGPLARLALLRIAQHLGFDPLRLDLERGSTIQVLCETCPDPGHSQREPDLLVRTDRAALLIEHKVHSGESDVDQYADYLDVLRHWAGSRRCAAHLLAKDDRPAPENWGDSMSHRQLAQVLRPLVKTAPSYWDRVRVALLVEDLDPDPNAHRMAEIRRLLDRTKGQALAVRDVRTLSNLLRRDLVVPRAGGIDVE